MNDDNGKIRPPVTIADVDAMTRYDCYRLGYQQGFGIGELSQRRNPLMWFSKREDRATTFFSWVLAATLTIACALLWLTDGVPRALFIPLVVAAMRMLAWQWALWMVLDAEQEGSTP